MVPFAPVMRARRLFDRTERVLSSIIIPSHTVAWIWNSDKRSSFSARSSEAFRFTHRVPVRHGRPHPRCLERAAIRIRGLVLLGVIAEVGLEEAGGADREEVLVHDRINTKMACRYQFIHRHGTLALPQSRPLSPNSGRTPALGAELGPVVGKRSELRHPEPAQI